ncbi:MAG TPA: class I SAM-dependent methyltransferase [Candidatus Acidoferrum sp.]|nr:class I SAM-dependent methyltransferase [Candidatus Acidoferrum sp.]
MNQPEFDPRTFDAYAAQYDAALQQGLAVSGEGKEYFAQGRINWLTKLLAGLREEPQSVLDFGCGTGTSARLFRDRFPRAEILGVDVSAKSLEIARELHGSRQIGFASLTEYQPEERFALAFCNGVFHHISLPDRAGAVNYVFRCLRLGGLFAFWENNPWNPGARLVMKRIPFDRDAIPLSPLNAARLLRAGGFQILRTDFQFIFPRVLKCLRGFEPILSRLPLGAQYQVLCRKPEGATVR